MRQIIPLDNSPNQSMTVTVEVDGENKTYNIMLRYNEMAEYWVVTLTDVETGLIVLDSLPLLRGSFYAGNMLEIHSYLGIGSLYLIKNSGSRDWPNDKSLGKQFELLWSDNIE